MRKLVLILLAGCGGYHMKVARFVDESEWTSKAWICVPDDDVTNPKGIECADMLEVLKVHEAKQHLGSDSPADM